MKKIKCSRKIVIGIVTFLIFMTVTLYFRHKISGIYTDAIRLYNQKEYDCAIEKFDSIGDYKDSYQYIDKAKCGKKYQEALEYLNQNKYEKAIKLFEEIAEYSDSKRKAQEAKYKWAKSLFENAEYLKAEQLFSELGAFSDSALYKAKCSLKMIESDKQEIYQYACNLYNEGKFDQAFSNFSQISDYKDSQEYIDWCEEYIRRYELATTICAGVRYSLAIDENCSVKIATNEYNDGFNFEGWEDLVSISGKSYIVLGLKSDGKVYETHLKDLPYKIDVSDWSDIIQICTGDQFAVGLKSDGSINITGRNYENQYLVKEWKNIVQISVSHRTIVGLDKKGNLHFAGYHSKELLSMYQKNKDKWKSLEYVEISGGDAVNNLGHVIGLKNDNTVIAIGDAFDSSEYKVDDLEDVSRVALGDNHILAITKNGKIIVVGNPGTIDYAGQNSKEKIEKWPVEDIVNLSAGNNLSLALTKSGEVFAAGNDKQGQLLANDWKNIKVIH